MAPPTLAPKRCPSCGDEFVSTALRCPVCDVALVAGGAAPAGPEVLASGDLVPLRSDTAAWIESLADDLAEAGIPCRVEIAAKQPDRARAGPAVVLLVRREDLPRARQVDAEVLRRQVPDLAEHLEVGPGESDACPACGTPLAPDALECGECGLGFAGEEE
jgi:hypothetical protein